MKTEFTLQEVFARLSDEGLIKPVDDKTLLNRVVTTEARGSSLPWYVKLFIGLSAWIAAILIVVFLFTIKIVDEDTALVFGLVFCAIAVALSQVGRKNIFWGQLSLAMSLTGQALAIVGLLETVDKLLFVTILITILETVLIWLHRDAVLRFIATLVVVSFLLAYIFDEDALNALHLLIFVLAAGSLYIHLLETRLKLSAIGEVLLPVNSAITFSYLGILTMPLMDEFKLDWRITALTFFVLLLFLLSRIIQDLGYTLRNRVVIALTAGCALLLVPSLRMPGILAALLVLIIGFWHNDRGLMGLASIFLVFYVWAYYYSLEWTLLAKSLVLLASGIILLVLRYFVVRFTTKAGGEA